MLLAFYLICDSPAARYASHAASRLAVVSGAPALRQCKVPFSCEPDWRNWALFVTTVGGEGPLYLKHQTSLVM